MFTIVAATTLTRPRDPRCCVAVVAAAVVVAALACFERFAPLQLLRRCNVIFIVFVVLVVVVVVVVLANALLLLLWLPLFALPFLGAPRSVSCTCASSGGG